MSTQEWPADDYAIGSYIQSTVAEQYLSKFQPKPTDHVLDLGCGNGAFTKKILDKVPQGSVLGADASENMLQLAQKIISDYPNFSIKKVDVNTMHFNAQFDYIVSFWCLQWIDDVHKAFANISNALKGGGKLFAILPAGDDPYIMGYYAIKNSEQFSSLNHFKPPVEYSKFKNLSETLQDLPFENLKIELLRQSITLPSLDTFRKFVNGIAFYQGQVPDAEIKRINENLVNYFDNECQRKYQGKYQFDFTIYLITATKNLRSSD